MAGREEWLLLICLVLFISGSAATKSYSIPEMRNSKSVNGTCKYAGELLPDGIACTVFYVCVGSPLTPAQQTCPAEEYFNPATNLCDPEYNCTRGCITEGQELADPENCANYFICAANLEPVLVTCGEGQFYDEGLANCVDADVVDCDTRPGCTYVGQPFPNFQHCSSFFVCDEDLVPVKLNCPSGQQYDASSNRCVSSGANCAAA